MSREESSPAPDDPTGIEWDAIVIGTGMGGGTVGYELARRGRRVLFLEKGRYLQRELDTQPGELADESEDPAERLRRGLWPGPIDGFTEVERSASRRLWSPMRGRLGDGEVSFYAPLGCGTGGSTIIYGSTLERFHPTDFSPRANFPEVEDSTLPETWPIEWDAFEPYYCEAERLYRVHGTSDPLHPADDSFLPEPPPLNDRDQAVHDWFERKGLHPYRSHIGAEFVPGCQGCGGRLCPRRCKSDAGLICVEPAIEALGARILSECEVTRLEADARSVETVHARWQGREIALRGRVVILAAGALMSPVLLLNSTGEHWPDGLANRTGLVGRNLMVHAGDFIAVSPDRRGEGGGFTKSLSINDLYFSEGRKLGNFQSLGLPVDSGTVMAHLRASMLKKPLWLRRIVPSILLRIAARIGAFYFRNAVVFSSILEDLPYLDNRVEPDPTAHNGMRFSYRYPEELSERNEVFRRSLIQRLGRRRVAVLTNSVNLNFGHPCGTIRFGQDPDASVLDPDNRAHDVENLYVVDASFFPSSGGVNPSLTIAANALRVAAIIDGRLDESARAEE